MRVSIVGQPAIAADFAVEGLVASPNDIAPIADRLRAEVTARGHSRRSSVVRRVVQSAAPAVVLDPEVVADVCAQLERVGDFQEVSGGVLFATPLRAVDLGSSECRIVSSMPTNWLPLDSFEHCVSDGVVRRCRVKSDAESEWRSEISATGGVVISVEAWAGFERTPKADGSWLAWLGARLAQPSAAGTLDGQGALAWNGLISPDREPRWRAGEKAAHARLWRAWIQWGYWVYAWTDGGPPSARPFVQLRGDEGARTVFAIARESGEPVRLQIRRQRDDSLLSVTQWLPYAEYRFLSAYASLSDATSSSKGWIIPRERVDATIEALADRLGLVTVESPAA